MVRPRFGKLPAQQQQSIRAAARDEFARHGFHDASLNRVIEAAGISKGSMYYYFDGKDDLYVYVLRTELEGLVDRLGPLSMPSEGDPERFWSALTDYYLRSMSMLTESPDLVALIRGWLAASTTPALAQALAEFEQAVMPWLQEALRRRQQVGAVRRDLPSTLLIAVVLGMGQAMDSWLMAQPPDPADLPGIVEALVDMIRGAMQP